MISVSVYRKDLVAANACAAGLALYDAIAALQSETDVRRGRRLRVGQWTPLHTVWLHSVCSSFAAWAEQRNIIPRANLYGANLYGANLYGANLRGANLYGANLRGANLYGANLYGANLCGANLYGANLYGANLCGANLYGANLRGANLSGASLSGANLSGADLRAASLSGAYRPTDPPPGWRTSAAGYLEAVS